MTKTEIIRYLETPTKKKELKALAKKLHLSLGELIRSGIAYEMK